MVDYEERLRAIRLGKKLLRERRRIKFIGLMRKTGKRMKFVRVE